MKLEEYMTEQPIHYHKEKYLIMRDLLMEYLMKHTKNVFEKNNISYCLNGGMVLRKVIYSQYPRVSKDIDLAIFENIDDEKLDVLMNNVKKDTIEEINSVWDNKIDFNLSLSKGTVMKKRNILSESYHLKLNTLNLDKTFFHNNFHIMFDISKNFMTIFDYFNRRVHSNYFLKENEYFAKIVSNENLLASKLVGYTSRIMNSEIINKYSINRNKDLYDLLKISEVGSVDFEKVNNILENRFYWDSVSYENFKRKKGEILKLSDEKFKNILISDIKNFRHKKDSWSDDKFYQTSIIGLDKKSEIDLSAMIKNYKELMKKILV